MTIQHEITQQLEQQFSPVHLSVENESHMHNVAPGSESHFKVTIVTDQFEGLMLIKRHRAVNAELKTILDKIHALALHTMTPNEWFEKGGAVADSPECLGGGKDQ